jgi:hypothetical protein
MNQGKSLEDLQKVLQNLEKGEELWVKWQLKIKIL